MGKIMTEVLGKADVSFNSDGILIRKDKKEGREDLIDEALKYNGELPANVTPVAPVQRNTRQVPVNASPRPVQNAVQPPPSAPASTPTPGKQ
jgi:hypothetical protein